MLIQKALDAVCEPVGDAPDLRFGQARDLAQPVLSRLAGHRVGEDLGERQRTGPFIQRHRSFDRKHELVERQDPVLIPVQTAEKVIFLTKVLLGHVGDGIELLQGHKQVLFLDVAD